MTLTEYAKRRGVATMSVSRAVRDGRLVECVARDARGIPSITDPEMADREWEANTRARVDGPPVAPPSSRPAVQPSSPPAAEKSESAFRITGRSPAVPDYNASRARRAEASARREQAMAELAELELAQKRGQLVDANAARADVEQAYSLVKTRLLRVPSDLAQRLPHVAAEVVPVLDELQRAALEELAVR